MGLYRADSELFNLLQVPSELDKETVVNNILMECAELEVLYPNPAFMKYAIGEWSKMYQQIWKKLAIVEAGLTEPWDYEEETIKSQNTEESSNEITNTLSSDGTDATGGADTTTHKVAGFNSENFVNSSQDSIDYGGTVKRTLKNTNSGNENSNRTNTGNITRTRYKREDMINKFNTFSKINVIETIVSQFKERFCLLIY